MLQRTIVLPFEILYLHYLTVMVVLFFVNRDWNINLRKILCFFLCTVSGSIHSLISPRKKRVSLNHHVKNQDSGEDTNNDGAYT